MKEVKIVATSDIHGELDFKIPCGDILTISGDICPVRGSHHPTTQEHWIKNHFIPWCKELIDLEIVKYVVFINGNHDFYFEKLMKDNKETEFRLSLPKNVYYLRDSAVEVEGVKIYGTPFTTIFGRWANMEPESVLDEIYSKIPEGLDILLSHGPAYGWNDTIMQYPDRTSPPNDHIGSKSLRKHILRAKPLWTFCGHIHSGSHDVTKLPVMLDDLEIRKKMNVVNVSLLDEDYQKAYTPFQCSIYKE